MLMPQWQTKTPMRGGPERSSRLDRCHGTSSTRWPARKSCGAGRRRRGLGHHIGDHLRSHGAAADKDPIPRRLDRRDGRIQPGEEAVLVRPDAEDFGELNGPVVRGGGHREHHQIGRACRSCRCASVSSTKHLEGVVPGNLSILAGRPRMIPGTVLLLRSLERNRRSPFRRRGDRCRGW